ncbi:substrate-binding periplasmic protein [Pseudomonas anguilliseptica]|uniref:Amino acid ABC transporter substrate-binding protein, PAAT family n=1 Tax=Pseudomonas anguilliseptica TaxID=53406 RepID=A0A1H4ZLN7_PSEAG|nr:transporter substrate-binding domain-containing protein [Pseudomonas anguilliseptica]SED30300.1 amino acid ABC transporter substrate-binding protein, PAAT family [Pseudomonas anguilliseptica]
MLLRHALLTLIALIASRNSAAENLHFVTEEFPPFSYSRGATASGALPDIVEATCRTLQWQCHIEVLPWRRALQQAEDGEVDGIFTVIQSPARRQAFRITPMLVTSGYDFYTLRSSNFHYSQPGDLQGRQVRVYGPSGTSFVLQESLKNTPDVEVKLVTNNHRLLLILTAGRFGERGVVVLNRDVARHLIEHEYLYALRNAGHLTSISYGIGFSRKKVTPAQFQAFNRGLRTLRNNGQLATIVQRYGLQPAN